MASLEIDKIQIQVSAETGAAIKNMTKLKNSLGKVREAVNECASISSEGMDKLKELTQTIKTLAFSGTGLKTVAEALKTIGRKSVGKFLKDIKEAQEETAKDFSGTVEKTSETVEGEVEKLKKGTEATKDFKKEWEKLKKSFADTRLGKSFTKISEFISSLKRIAMYRILRSAIKAVTQAFSEGREIYLEWSRSVGGEFAEVMDRLTTKFTLLKASLGSLTGEIITFFEPALQWLMEAVINVSNAFTQMFAHLNGSDTWNKAYIKDAQAVVDANRKMKQSFLGIDEINTLGNNNGNSAAQSLLGIGYEETPVNKKTAITLEAILGTVTAIGLALKTWDIIKFVGQLEKVVGVGGVGNIPLASGGTVGGLLGTLLGAAITIGGTVLMTLGFKSMMQDGIDYKNIIMGTVGTYLAGAGLLMTGHAVAGSFVIGLGGLVMMTLGFKSQMEEGLNIYNTIATLIGGALTGAGLAATFLGASAGPYGLAFGIAFSLIGVGIMSIVSDEKFQKEFKAFQEETTYTGINPFVPDTPSPDQFDTRVARHTALYPNLFAKDPTKLDTGLLNIIANHPEWATDENESLYEWANQVTFGNKDNGSAGGTINLYLDGQVLASTMSAYQTKAQTQLGVYQ